MGAFTGGLTFRQYYVTDPMPTDWKDTFPAAIARHTFQPIDPQSEEERAVGWCSPHFPLDIDLEPGQYLYNEYIVLALRIDTLGVPGPLLRIYSEKEARRVMAEQKRASLNRYEKAEIKERVKLDLRRKMLPSIKAIDMVWSWSEGTVRFFSTNEKVNLEFMELFEATFELQLTPEAPLTAGLHGWMGLTEDEQAGLERLEPCSFVDADTALAAMREV